MSRLSNHRVDGIRGNLVFRCNALSFLPTPAGTIGSLHGHSRVRAGSPPATRVVTTVETKFPQDTLQYFQGQAVSIKIGTQELQYGKHS